MDILDVSIVMCISIANTVFDILFVKDQKALSLYCIERPCKCNQCDKKYQSNNWSSYITHVLRNVNFYKLFITLNVKFFFDYPPLKKTPRKNNKKQAMSYLPVMGQLTFKHWLTSRNTLIKLCQFNIKNGNVI